MKKQRLVVGISGSSGAILGIRLLEALQRTPVETHLIITPSARVTIEQETAWKSADVLQLADAFYNPRDVGASIASGSFETMGMVVIPCSIKSLSAIANSYSGDLLTRSADVTLKEGRKLILVLREAPLHAGHIRLMEQAANIGAVLFPPVPAFYTHPKTVDDIVDNIVGRVLRRMGIENDLYAQWQGLHSDTSNPEKVETGFPQAEQQPMPQALQEEELWSLPVMTLATTGASGAPHAAAVYFTGGADNMLYFFSDAGSQHSQDLRANPQAAATIHPLLDGWQEIRGLQLRGEVSVVEPGPEWDKAWEQYLVKFPFTGDLKEIVARNTLYAFHITFARIIDNRRGFGFKEEWTQNV
jgi:flavin prenyltransferase